MSTQTISPEVSVPNLLPRKRAGLRILQPKVTYTGAPIKPLHRGLPKTTESLCPECTKVIPAMVIADDGKVIMQKSCPEHGEFRDIVFSDIELYLKMEEWNFGDNLACRTRRSRARRHVPMTAACAVCTHRTPHSRT